MPGKVVAAVLATAGIIKNYIYGNITASECIAQLGETGVATSTAAAGMYAGAVLIPLPVIGSLIGGMVGYMLSGKVFTALSGALSSAKLARRSGFESKRNAPSPYGRYRSTGGSWMKSRRNISKKPEGL